MKRDDEGARMFHGPKHYISSKYLNDVNFTTFITRLVNKLFTSKLLPLIKRGLSAVYLGSRYLNCYSLKTYTSTVLQIDY